MNKELKIKLSLGGTTVEVTGQVSEEQAVSFNNYNDNIYMYLSWESNTLEMSNDTNNMNENSKNGEETMWTLGENVSGDSELGMMARQDLNVLIKKEEVDELWIGDTGASSHMCKVWKGFSNTKSVNIKAEFAREGHEGKVDKIGTWSGIV